MEARNRSWSCHYPYITSTYRYFSWWTHKSKGPNPNEVPPQVLPQRRFHQRLASDDNGCVATRRYACPLDKCYPDGRRQPRISWTHKCQCCMQFSDKFTESLRNQWFCVSKHFFLWAYHSISGLKMMVHGYPLAIKRGWKFHRWLSHLDPAKKFWDFPAMIDYRVVRNNWN